MNNATHYLCITKQKLCLNSCTSENGVVHNKASKFEDKFGGCIVVTYYHMKITDGVFIFV